MMQHAMTAGAAASEQGPFWRATVTSMESMVCLQRMCNRLSGVGPCQRDLHKRITPCITDSLVMVGTGCKRCAVGGVNTEAPCTISNVPSDRQYNERKYKAASANCCHSVVLKAVASSSPPSWHYHAVIPHHDSGIASPAVYPLVDLLTWPRHHLHMLDLCVSLHPAAPIGRAPGHCAHSSCRPPRLDQLGHMRLLGTWHTPSLHSPAQGAGCSSLQLAPMARHLPCWLHTRASALAPASYMQIHAIRYSAYPLGRHLSLPRSPLGHPLEPAMCQYMPN